MKKILVDMAKVYLIQATTEVKIICSIRKQELEGHLENFLALCAELSNEFQLKQDTLMDLEKD